MSAVQVGHVVTGREDGPVVVLSNSLGSTYHMWDAQLAALEERFRVVRYDTRGHGVSPVPDGPYRSTTSPTTSSTCSTGSASGGPTSSGCRSAA